MTIEQAEWLEANAGLPWLDGLMLFIKRFGLGEGEAVAIWEAWLETRGD